MFQGKNIRQKNTDFLPKCHTNPLGIRNDIEKLMQILKCAIVKLSLRLKHKKTRFDYRFNLFNHIYKF